MSIFRVRSGLFSLTSFLYVFNTFSPMISLISCDLSFRFLSWRFASILNVLNSLFFNRAIACFSIFLISRSHFFAKETFCYPRKGLYLGTADFEHDCDIIQLSSILGGATKPYLVFCYCHRVLVDE